MIKAQRFALLVLALVGAAVLAACQAGGGGGDTIKVGLNLELTGSIPKVGEHSRVAAEMYAEEVNAAGGLDVGGKKYNIELVVEDNNGTAEGAAAAANKLVTQDNVLVLVGPNASVAAVPAGEVANNLATPMISPWSTNPNTTLNRPWVFRAPFLDPFQGPVVANFATEQFGAEKACVLFDVASDYPKGLADNFKSAWEGLHGPGSVVAFESFTTGDQDFSAQLTKIKATDCQVLFTPQYYSEVPLIVELPRTWASPCRSWAATPGATPNCWSCAAMPARASSTAPTTPLPARPARQRSSSTNSRLATAKSPATSAR